MYSRSVIDNELVATGVNKEIYALINKTLQKRNKHTHTHTPTGVVKKC